MKFKLQKVEDGPQAGQYWWTLVFENGEPCCHSETYHNKVDCIHSIHTMRRFFLLQRPPIVDLTGDEPHGGE